MSCPRQQFQGNMLRFFLPILLYSYKVGLCRKEDWFDKILMPMFQKGLLRIQLLPCPDFHIVFHDENISKAVYDLFNQSSTS